MALYSISILRIDFCKKSKKIVKRLSPSEMNNYCPFLLIFNRSFKNSYIGQLVVSSRVPDIRPVPHTAHNHALLTRKLVGSLLELNEDEGGGDRREGVREFVRISPPIPDISSVSHSAHHHSLLTRKLISSRLKLDEGEGG